MSLLNFKDQVIVVTGGSRGIGQAMVEAFSRAGGKVIFTYASSSEKAEAIANNLESEGCFAKCYKVDVQNTDETESFVKMVESEFGAPDILVNNAGIIRDQLLLTMDPDDWNSVIDTNLTGCFRMIKPVVRGMMRKRKGSIINISSMAASNPGRGHSNYAASKGGIESFTKALAAELGGKGIRVNAVAPGMIETDMSEAVRDAAGDQIKARITLRRFGKPEDIANAVLFLASDMSSYVTGEVLHVDGGIS